MFDSTTHFLGNPLLPYDLLFCASVLTLAIYVYLNGKNRELKLKAQAHLLSEQLMNAELQTAHKQILYLATHDQLTGVLNRGGLEEAVLRLRGQPFSALLIDADRFKRINDTHGHDVGDEVLVTFANIIQHNLKGGSTVARFGGEEFIVILPQVCLQGAIAIGERLRKALDRELNIHLEDAVGEITVKISASIGAATAPAEYAPNDILQVAKAIIKAADVQVYEAKEAGRNCVRPLSEEVNPAPPAE